MEGTRFTPVAGGESLDEIRKTAPKNTRRQPPATPQDSLQEHQKTLFDARVCSAMVPLQSGLGGAAGWLAFLALALVPGLVTTLLWAPFLAATRIRSLFEALPPVGRLLPTYVLACVGASVPYVAGLLLVLATVDPAGAGLSNAILDVTLQLSLLYVVGFPLAGALVLPRLGVDWDPTGYGTSTWGLLVAGGVWYAVLFAVPLVGLSLVFALPGGY